LWGKIKSLTIAVLKERDREYWKSFELPVECGTKIKIKTYFS
jgi:hypothetical protein